MRLSSGTRIGPYEVAALIGTGGMGEVFRARDTKLNRDVAIKVLPEAVAADPERRSRFHREAQVLAALNHPNIAHVYGYEEAGGIHALVMELVDGPTLADRIALGPIPVDQALVIAKQIAEALEAAHEQGIIHRDLKPANIKVRADGTVKVLDFGLAKLADPNAASSSDVTATPTISSATVAGVVVGTPAYMSPEQARGGKIDKRTDVWAFGCVLYEMLAGRPAFPGTTVVDILAAVVNRDPDWTLLPSSTPTHIARVLRRCLARDPKKRLRDIGDASADIEEVGFPGTAPQAAPGWRPWQRVGWAVALLLVGLAAGVFFARRDGTIRAAVAPRVQFDLTLAQLPFGFGASVIPVPSPDGRALAYVGSSRDGSTAVWVRSIDSIQAHRLTDTDAASGALAWSPDGLWLAFFANGILKKIAPAGGPARTIARVAGFQDAAWGASGEILFRTTNREALVSVSESGGTPRPVTTLNASLGENSHRAPQFLPDGRRFLFTTRCNQLENDALYVGSLDSKRVTRVMPARARVQYLPLPSGNGTLLFYKDGALMAQRFDLVRSAVQGAIVPVFDKISYVPASIQAGFRASDDGHVVIVEEAGANDSRLTWFDRNGVETGTLGGPADYVQPRIAPTGDRVVFVKADERNGNRDLWYADIARGIIAPLTTNAANDWYPAWSSDGKQLLFSSDRENGIALPIYIKRGVDIGAEEVPVPDSAPAPPWDWSPDGRWAISNWMGGIWVQDIRNRSKPFEFLTTTFAESGGRISPDGKWITYVSSESGRAEVYVRPFTGGPATPAGKIQISGMGGDFPTWGLQGSELYFMSRESDIYAVSTRSFTSTAPSPMPQRLFKACPETTPLAPPATHQSYLYAFDTRDGQHFLLNCRVQQTGKYVVLVNPLSDLGR